VLFVSLAALVVRGTGSSAAPSWPLGFGPLIVWALFLVAWTPRTYDLAFSVGYTAWFVISCLLIWTAYRFYQANPNLFVGITRFYINTYVFVALFGLFQFAAGIFGYSLLTTQWWIEDKLPRINGFSYEPSYFATYLITGWGMLAWMIERKASPFSPLRTKASFAIISLALVLSSSRMGVLVMAVYIAIYFIRGVLRSILTFRISSDFLLSIASFIAICLSVFALIVSTVGFRSLTFLLFGTGLARTADHSSATRLGQLAETWELFLASPIFGYGLGGVWSYIGRMTGAPPGEATGMNVTIEVLAASGAIGFVFYAWYLARNVVSSFEGIGKKDWRGEILGAYGVGLMMIYIILQFNQGIMRVYLWNHLALLAAAYGHYRLALPGRPTLRRRQGSRVRAPLRVAIRPAE
jgi:O-antigen ligase